VTVTGTPTVTVSFDKDDNFLDKVFGGAFETNAVSSGIAGALQQGLPEVFAVDLDPISVFAVSNLLFPGEHVLHLQQAYAPGDMALLGAVRQLIAVSPALQTLGPGTTAQFSAVVPGSPGESVTWTMQPRLGTLTTAGLYTAPSTIDADRSVVITAVSTDGTEVASALVLLQAPLIITPTAARVTAGQVVQFGAIAGAAPADVVWALEPGAAGTLDDSGAYTAPDTIASDTEATITATARADSSLTATAVVTLTSSISG
jgi:hypothetical protein